MFRTALLLIALTSLSLCAKTPKPWPNNWHAKFTEDVSMKFKGKDTITGEWWYSAEQQAQRTDRSNGKLNRMCGLTRFFTNSRCSEVVTNGVRYLYYPELNNYCCKCCEAKHGCDILKPGWVKIMNYVKEETLKTGVQVNTWTYGKDTTLKMIYQDSNGRMHRMSQGPASDLYWDMNTYSESKIDPAVFAVPNGGNCNTLCPSISTCNLFRSGLVDGR